MNYTVAVHTEGEGPAAQSTPDLDEALDWFTNACTEVMDPETPETFATFHAAGVLVGAIRLDGLSGGGGEVIELPRQAAA